MTQRVAQRDQETGGGFGSSLRGRRLSQRGDKCTTDHHAISVHRADVESDYYTAVDDHKEREEDDAGAGS